MDQHITTIAMQVAARVVDTASDDIGVLWEEYPDLNQEQIEAVSSRLHRLAYFINPSPADVDAAVAALGSITATEEPQP
jgi:hypothetical protein